MSCCGFSDLNNGTNLIDYCHKNTMQNPNNNLRRFYKLFTQGCKNGMIYCAKINGVHYYAPCVNFGAYTFLNPSNIDVDIYNHIDAFENLIRDIEFKRSEYVPDLFDMSCGISLEHHLRCLLDKSNTGTSVYTGSILHIMPTIDKCLIKENNDFHGLLMPTISVLLMDNIIWTTINTDIANEFHNIIDGNCKFNSKNNQEHVWVRLFNTSPLHTPTVMGVNKINDKTASLGDGIKVKIQNKKNTIPNGELLDEFIELGGRSEIKKVARLKFKYSIRLLFWVYTLAMRGARPFPGAFYNYMLVRQPNDCIVYNHLIPAGTYLMPMLLNISVAYGDCGKYTIFCRYFIYILRLFVTQNREFKSCVCYIARYLHERVRSLPEIVDFIGYLDSFYNKSEMIETKLVSAQNWPIKLDLRHDRIVNGQDVMFNGLNKFFIDQMLKIMIYMTQLAIASENIEQKPSRRGVIHNYSTANSKLLAIDLIDLL